MSENTSSASSPKGELEQLSAIEESMASFGIGDLDSEQGVILRDWSAQNFANIYVRFRPHLISHARKFLREESQAEEVVQDAFLYLMTALPDLDSELGVLRFLKWKTKMLCLDIIRSSQAGLNNNLVPLPDDVADETQPLDSLERADDAAIIRLALAKLSPRHREALVATMYEERSHEEAAQQLGIGENAFRQLLFRARASFRKALVGEAEVEGKSISELLSLAASKAAKEAPKLAAGAGGILLVLGILALPTGGSEQLASELTVVEQSELPGVENDAGDTFVTNEIPMEHELVGEQDYLAGATSPGATETGVLEIDAPDLTEDQFLLKERPEEKESTLALALDNRFTYQLAESTDIKVERDQPGLAVLAASNGIKAHLAYDVNTESIIQYSHFEIPIEGQVLTSVPKTFLTVVERTGEFLKINFASTDFVVGDFDGAFNFESVTQSPFSQSTMLVMLTLDHQGELVAGDLKLVPKA